MNLKSIIYMTLFILIYLVVYSLFGGGVALMCLSILLLGQAILFTLKPLLYDRYMSFINPSIYKAICEKDETFIVGRRKMNTVGLYIMAVLMGVNSFLQFQLKGDGPDLVFSNFGSMLLYIVATLSVVFVVVSLATWSIKQSETVSEDFAWNIAIGVGAAFLIMGSSLVYFLFIR